MSLTKYAFSESTAVIHGKVMGKVMINQAYVDMKWVFITLPVAVLGLIIVFFISAIFLNTTFGLYLWKISSLPGLYHGLDNSMLLESDEHTTLGQMEKTSQDIYVQLQFWNRRGS